MRQIKFRAQRKDNKEWVVGYLSAPDEITVEVEDDSTGFLTYDEYGVIPETVGQFTGRQDVNGKDIYEGDILDISHKNGTAGYEVFWNEDEAQWGLIHAKRWGDKYGVYTRNFGLREKKTIIGSIHTHPELIKEKV